MHRKIEFIFHSISCFFVFKSNCVFVPVVYHTICHCWSIDYKKDDCVNSKQVADTILSLPVHAYLEQKEIATIVKNIKVAIDER